MLELHCIDEASALFGANRRSRPALTVGLARTWDEVQAAQRLRHRVFAQELGAQLNGAGGLDQDRFDRHCEHLLVRCNRSGDVVGTYRILTPEQARAAGSYYAEGEFDLSPLDPIRADLVEFGRSCVHPDYRQGGVILLLWAGLASYLQRHGYRYVFGCATVSLQDGGVAAAWLADCARDEELSSVYRVVPHRSFGMAPDYEVVPARVPALLKGYLKLGAKICGEPAWDPQFNSADFPMLFDVTDMRPRYRRHFKVTLDPATDPIAAW
jgi:putative hemolysin